MDTPSSPGCLLGYLSWNDLGYCHVEVKPCVYRRFYFGTGFLLCGHKSTKWTYLFGIAEVKKV